MSDLRKEEDTETRTASTDAAILQYQDLFGGNWEERLAKARAQREQIMRAQGKPARPASAERPPFLDEAPVRTPRTLRATARTDFKTRKATAAFNAFGVYGGSAQHAPAAADTAGVAPQPVIGTAQDRSSPDRRTLVLASSLGLGFGVVLSLGAVLALGWVSFPGLDPNRAEPGAPVVAEAPVPMQEMNDMASAFVSRFNFQPATVSVALTSPSGLSRTPEPLLGARDPGADPLPLVLNAPQVEKMVVTASLQIPRFTETAAAPAGSADEMPPTQDAPQLFAGLPGVVPVVLSTPPEKLTVFDQGVPERLGPEPELGENAVPMARLDAPPDLVQAPAAPLLQAVASPLPEIGGPDETRATLASKLGFGGAAAGQVRLVPIAPETVTEDRLADTSGLLSATGFPVSSLTRVNFRVSQTHVRYYNREDETVAQAVAAELGGTAKDFTTLSGAPGPGHIEIWLQGSGTTAQPARTARSTPTAAQRRAAEKNLLQNRLVNSLRRGDQYGPSR